MESLLLIVLLHKRDLERRRQKQKERHVMSRNQHTCFGTLNKEERCRRRMKVPWSALLPQTALAFVKLFWLGDNPALIRLTGFDHGLFCTILAM